MSVLTIATADLRRLAGLDATDTSQDAALSAQATAEQGALEYALDPATLAAAAAAGGALKALLTLGISEQIAGSYLQQQARAPLQLGNITLGSLVLVPPSPVSLMRLGDALALKGTVRLAAYTTTAVANAAQAAADKARAVSLAAAKVSQAQADAATRADLDAAKLAIAQGQAAKYEAEDTSDNGALISNPSLITSGDTRSAFDCEDDQ